MDKTEILDRFLGESSHITIAVHTHPDGDAVGSGVALLQFLKEVLGKDAALVFPDRVQESLGFLTVEAGGGCVLVFDEDEAAATERISRSDLIFCLDANSFSRTGRMEDLLRETKATKVLVDHHLSPEDEAFDLVISKTSVSSTCELLYYTLLGLPSTGGSAKALPSLTARALLTGMTTDTNNFANSVFPSTFAMASGLVEAGVDREDILGRLYNSSRENRVRLMGRLLDKSLETTPSGAALIILDKATQEDFQMRPGETEGFVNIPLSIENVRLSLFLTETEDRFRVSIRSKKGTSANQMAASFFNGGGHEQASGGKLVFGQDIDTPGEARAYVLKAIDEFLSQ